MAKYDAMGDKVKRRIPFSLWIMLAGLVISVVGIAWCFNTNISKYLDIESFSESYDSTSISQCDIKFAVGASKITKSPDNKIHISATDVPSGIYEYGTDGNKFYLKSNDFSFNINNIISFVHFGDWYNENDNLSVTVELPEKEFDDISVKNGVGQLDMSFVKAHNLTLKNGVGQLNLSDCSFDDASLKNGVGEINTESVTFGETSIKNGVGSINCDGTFNGNIDIDNGVGDCNLSVIGNGDDYDIDYNSDDNITVNGKNGNSTGNSKYDIDIDSGVGEVEIDFR